MTKPRSSTAIDFRNGVVLNEMPSVSNYSGDIYFVNSNGGGGSKGTFDAPFLTVSEALSAVTNDKGDLIVVKAGHTETLSATVSSSASGFAIIGQGWGDMRPTFTNGLSGTDDAFDLSGDDVSIINLKWKEAASGTTITVLNLSGDHVYLGGNYFELGATTKLAVVHDTAAVGMISERNTFYGTAAGPDYAFNFEAQMKNFRSYDDVFHFGESAGVDNGCYHFTVTGYGHLIARPEITGLGDGESVVKQTVTQVDSLCYGARVIGDDVSDHLCDGSNTPTSGGFAFLDCQAAEAGGSGYTTVA